MRLFPPQVGEAFNQFLKISYEDLLQPIVIHPSASILTKVRKPYFVWQSENSQNNFASDRKKDNPFFCKKLPLFSCLTLFELQRPFCTPPLTLGNLSTSDVYLFLNHKFHLYWYRLCPDIIIAVIVNFFSSRYTKLHRVRVCECILQSSMTG